MFWKSESGNIQATKLFCNLVLALGSIWFLVFLCLLPW